MVGRLSMLSQTSMLTSKLKAPPSSTLARPFTSDRIQTPHNQMALDTRLSPSVASRKSHIHLTHHTHRVLTSISTTTRTGTATMVMDTITHIHIPTLQSAKPSRLLPLLLLSQSRCHRQVERLQPPPRHHQHEEILDRRRVLPPKLPNQSSVARQMARRIQRSVLDEDADHSYQNRGNKLAKSGSSEHVFVASSSRRPVTKASHVLDVNHLMHVFGKYLAHVSTSRTLDTS